MQKEDHPDSTKYNKSVSIRLNRVIRVQKKELISFELHSSPGRQRQFVPNKTLF